jgi:hypothetical protein
MPSFFSFDDPGPHGAGRYSDYMLPEIVKRDWRKGAQVIIYMLDFPRKWKPCFFYQIQVIQSHKIRLTKSHN